MAYYYQNEIVEHNLIMNKFKFQLLNQYGVQYKIQQLTP